MKPPKTTRPAAAPEDGRILPLGLGLAAIALAAILTVTTISVLHLERKELLALADSIAATVAAKPGQSPAQTARHTLEKQGVDGVEITQPTGFDPGGSAVVTLRKKTKPPLIKWILPQEGITITVSALGRAG